MRHSATYKAFNIRTGKLAWVFHTIPYPGEDGYDTWPKDVYKNTSDVGAANNWSGMSVDRARGIVYVPTGSAAYDFYGANRKVKICLQTVCLHSMQKPANVFGIFNWCITIYLTAIRRRLRI
jgi:glucose dehydrogenase